MHVVAGVADPGYNCSKVAKTQLTESNHMKRVIKTQTASLLTRGHCGQVLFTLGVLALCQGAHAVVPAPDGGYPGYNTAEGQNALFSRTTGLWNTALGAFTLFGDTTGTGNTAVGINGLRNNVTGAFNTAVGLNALYFNNGDPTNGEASFNSAFGTYALFHNTTGFDNCAFGASALISNNTGPWLLQYGNRCLHAREQYWQPQHGCGRYRARQERRRDVEHRHRRKRACEQHDWQLQYGDGSSRIAF